MSRPTLRPHLSIFDLSEGMYIFIYKLVRVQIYTFGEINNSEINRLGNESLAHITNGGRERAGETRTSNLFSRKIRPDTPEGHFFFILTETSSP